MNGFTDRQVGWAKVAAIALMAGLAAAEMYLRSYVLLFSGDEIINLDVVLSFFTQGDYTSEVFGGHPFDPIMSSGILVSWSHGLTFLLGGNLFLARWIGALLQFAAALSLAFRLGVSQGLRPLDAALGAISLWTVLLRVSEHELRFISLGEFTGFLFLAAGGLFVASRLRMAFFFWGLSVWLCKIIYLPSAVAFMLAAVWNQRLLAKRSPQHGGVVRSMFGCFAAFLAPLGAWMCLIGLRHDLGTVINWAFSYFAFVVKHATGIHVDLTGLPGLPGWQFSPGWVAPGTFGDVNNALFLFLPLFAGPILALRYLYLRGGRVGDALRLETAYLYATLLCVSVFALWFLALDPTRWGRHILPAVYVSVALGFYCLLAERNLGRSWFPKNLVGGLVCFAVVLASCAYTFAEIRPMVWKASYARACQGRDVLTPICVLEEGRKSVSQWSNEFCDLSLHELDFDEHCLWVNRSRFLERASEIMHQPDAAIHEVYRAGYVVLHVQRWAYTEEADWTADFARVFCRPQEPAVEQYFRQTGLDRHLQGRCGNDA